MPRHREPVDPAVLVDRGLNLRQLHAKYGGAEAGEHPVFGQQQWKEALAQKRTLDDYWGWVEYQIALGNETE